MNYTEKVGVQRCVEIWLTNAPRPRGKEMYLNSVGDTKMNEDYIYLLIGLSVWCMLSITFSMDRIATHTRVIRNCMVDGFEINGKIDKEKKL